MAARQMLSGHGPIPNRYALNEYFFPHNKQWLEVLELCKT